jgi:hypothetical protein
VCENSETESLFHFLKDVYDLDLAFAYLWTNKAINVSVQWLYVDQRVFVIDRAERASLHA